MNKDVLDEKQFSIVALKREVLKYSYLTKTGFFLNDKNWAVSYF